MKEKIRKEILEFLDIRDDENFSDIELFRLLDKKRKSMHPDRTTDETVKEEYEEKIKTLNILYTKFGEHIKANPSQNNDLQIYKGEVEFDYVTAKIENEELKNQIKSLETKIYLLEHDVKAKSDSIRRLNDTKVLEETSKLKSLYQPKKSNLIALSISAFLSGLILVLSSTKQAVSFYSENLSFLNPKTVSIVTLGVLIVVTSIFAINYFKKLLINSWTQKINSTHFTSRLFDFVRENLEPQKETHYSYSTKTQKFKERVIYNFIELEFKSKNVYITILRKTMGLNMYSVYENFKKIMIYELINKEIIKADGNSGFDKILKYED